jgi:hypothetical protein
LPRLVRPARTLRRRDHQPGFEQKRVFEITFIVGIEGGKLFVDGLLDRVVRPFFARIVGRRRQIVVEIEIGFADARSVQLGGFAVRIVGEIELRFAHIRFPSLVVFRSARLVIGDVDAIVDIEIFGRAVVERSVAVVLRQGVVVRTVLGGRIVLRAVERR